MVSMRLQKLVCRIGLYVPFMLCMTGLAAAFLPGCRKDESAVSVAPAPSDPLTATLVTRDGLAERLVMDELGPHEAQAVRFQAAVFRALEGGTPILGVLQQADSDFLRRIAGHPRVTVLTVTEDNRGSLGAELLRWREER